jgi:hypothetical protein
MIFFWFVPFFVVDERIPAATRDSISASEWKDFCSDVKARYQPMQQHLAEALVYGFLSMYFFLAGLIYLQLGIILGGFCYFFIMSVSLNQLAMVDILSELYKVCEKHSRSDRTFHVRQTWGHIRLELSIAPTAQTPLNPELAFVQNNATDDHPTRMR